MKPTLSSTRVILSKKSALGFVLLSGYDINELENTIRY